MGGSLGRADWVDVGRRRADLEAVEPIAAVIEADLHWAGSEWGNWIAVFWLSGQTKVHAVYMYISIISDA